MTDKFLKYFLALIPGALAFGVAAPQAQAVIDFGVKPSESLAFAPLEATASNSGAGFAIPDNDSAGTFSDITISDTFNIQDVTVTLNSLDHTFAGDLIATLTHVDTSTSVDLFNRPGINAFGDSSNLDGNFSFNDNFTGDFAASLTALPETTDVLAGGNYAPTTVDDLTSFLSAFNGESASGTWRLTVADNGDSDTGSLDSWDLTLSDTSAASVPFEFSPSLGILLVGVGFGIKHGRDRAKNQKVDFS